MAEEWGGHKEQFKYAPSCGPPHSSTPPSNKFSGHFDRKSWSASEDYEGEISSGDLLMEIQAGMIIQEFPLWIKMIY